MEYQSFKTELMFFYEFINNKRLNFCDFINEIKEDIMKKISKNRKFIDYHNKPYIPEKEKNISFSIKLIQDKNLCYPNDIFLKTDRNFDIDGLSEVDFVKAALCCADDELLSFVTGYDKSNSFYFDAYYKNRSEYHVKYSYNPVKIYKFDEKFHVGKIEMGIFLNYFKVIHKEKFFRRLHDEIMEVAWHPTRYLDWCVDFEELKFLEEEVWGEED